jgi:hypothetical protein
MNPSRRASHDSIATEFFGAAKCAERGADKAVFVRIDTGYKRRYSRTHGDVTRNRRTRMVDRKISYSRQYRLCEFCRIAGFHSYR